MAIKKTRIGTPKRGYKVQDGWRDMGYEYENVYDGDGYVDMERKVKRE